MNKTTRAFCKISVLALLFSGTACGSDDVEYVDIASITPDHGSQLGGNIVTVEGHGFAAIGAGLSNVVIGDNLALEVRIISDSKAFVTMPPSDAAGAVDFELFNSNGRNILGEGYSYNPQPTVTAASPGTGPAIGGTEITLTGTGFVGLEPGDNLVDFDGIPATVLSVVSDTELKVESPPGVAPKLNDISVANANGTGLYETAFAYQAPANSLFVFRHGLRPSYGPPQAPDLSAGELLHVDLDLLTMSSAIAAPTEGSFNGIGSAGFDGTNIYAKTLARDLIRLNPSTGERVNLGPIDQLTCDQGKLNDLVFHQGISYGFCRQNQVTAHFGRFNLDTLVFTPIGAGSGSTAQQTSLVSDGTTLYIIGRDDQSTSRIVELNPVTGAEVGEPVRIGLFSVRGAAFLNGKLYVLNQVFAGGGPTIRPSFLYELNPITGEHTFIMNMGTNLHALMSGL